MSEKKSGSPLAGKIQWCGWGLLATWLCAPLDADEEEIVKMCAEHGTGPTSNLALVRDRLYGGFKCEDPEKRHVCFATGQYTYLGQNSALTDEDRQRHWEDLIEQSKDTGGFIGGGAFTSDAPPHRGVTRQ